MWVGNIECMEDLETKFRNLDWDGVCISETSLKRENAMKLSLKSAIFRKEIRAIIWDD